MQRDCYSASKRYRTLKWRLNERDGVSNHLRLDCLLKRLFGHRSKKTRKLRATGLCEWNPPVTGGFPSQRASNAEMFPFMTSWWNTSKCHIYIFHGMYYSHRTKSSLVVLGKNPTLMGRNVDRMPVRWARMSRNVTSDVRRGVDKRKSLPTNNFRRGVSQVYLWKDRLISVPGMLPWWPLGLMKLFPKWGWYDSK